MAKKLFKIGCTEKVHAHYEVEADTEEEALEAFATEGQFIAYGDFIEVVEGTAVIE